MAKKKRMTFRQALGAVTEFLMICWNKGVAGDNDHIKAIQRDLLNVDAISAEELSECLDDLADKHLRRARYLSLASRAARGESLRKLADRGTGAYYVFASFEEKDEDTDDVD